MEDFRDKVAVVTGAASGIGRAIAAHCLQLGMKVVLADIEEAALYRTADALGTAGGRLVALPVDVSCAEQMEALCARTIEHFGGVHLLFNNAGVGAGTGPIWQASAADWEWVVRVNLMGVAHGLRVFVPVMLRQETDCHIVNTASVSGLLSSAFVGIYSMSKHAVVSISESLHNELAMQGSRIGVSVLCPGFTRTGIMDSARNRPAALQDIGWAESEQQKASAARLRQSVDNGMPPEQLADIVFDAIRARRFYIVSHPETRGWVNQRAADILEERNPRLHPGWGK